MFIYFYQTAKYFKYSNAIFKTNRIINCLVAVYIFTNFTNIKASDLPKKYTFAKLNVSLGEVYDENKLRAFHTEYSSTKEAFKELGENNKALTLILKHNSPAEIVRVITAYINNVHGSSASKKTLNEILKATLPSVSDEITTQKKIIDQQNAIINSAFALGCLYILFILFPK